MAKRSKATEGYVNPVVDAPDPVKFSDPDGKGVDKEKDEEQERVQKLVARLLNEAIDYYEEELQPDQVRATEYYNGEPFGDEKEGRSKVVNTVVRDATLAQMPALLAMIFEGDRPVEFSPGGPEDEALAQQATDYIKYVVVRDNPGFLNFWSWFEDGLVRRLGTAKYWWDESVTKTRTEYSGLGLQELQMLLSDPEVEIDGSVESTQTDTGTLYDVNTFHVKHEGRAVWKCLPNEEFFYTPNAESLEDARLCAHVREIPVDELKVMLMTDPDVDMDEDEIEELLKESKGQKRVTAQDLKNTRDGAITRRQPDTESKDDNVCIYGEVWAKVAVEDPDYETDEALMPELRLFKVVGPEFTIVNGKGLGKCTDDKPFADWTPIPVAHSIIGKSNWDMLKDLQRIISQVERGTLDSLAQSLQPVTEVVNGMVNMDDFIRAEVGGVRRVRAIGQTQTIVHHFVGGDTLPILDYYNKAVEDRAGKSRGNQIDIKSLQSTTQVAAQAYVDAARQRIEMIARVFCETGLPKLYQGLLKLVTKHQSPGRVVKLRNQWVSIDPRFWDAGMNCEVNMPIGAGTTSERLEIFGGMAGKQQELMSMGSPLVTNVELRNTLDKIVQLSGEKNTARYFKPFGEQEQQAMEQAQAQQPPPPDPQMALVKVEKAKAEAEMALKQQEFQLKQWEAIRKDDLERDKLARESVLKEKELELKFQAEIDDNMLKAQVARERAELDADVKREAVTAMGQPRTVRMERST